MSGEKEKKKVSKDVRRIVETSVKSILKSVITLNNDARQAGVFLTETPRGLKVFGPVRAQRKIHKMFKVIQNILLFIYYTLNDDTILDMTEHFLKNLYF